MIKVMALLLLLAFAGLFFIKGPGGEPILTLSDFKPDVPELPVSSLGKSGEAAEVYKWQDEAGQWHYSNNAQDKANGEVMLVDGDINIIPAIDPAVIKNLNRTSRQASQKQAQGQKLQIPDGLTSVSGDKVTQMMDTVNNLQNTVDAREKERQKILDDISASN